MNKFWSPHIRSLAAYVPGEQPRIENLVKLNTNENPYGPSPKVESALQAEATELLRLYPDPNAELLKAAVARYYAVEPTQVFVGNGSDEVLAHAFVALLKHDRPILFPDISYSFYPVYCQLFGIEKVEIPLTDNFEINIDDYLRSNGGIIFPNPNAPTGRALELGEIERLLTQNTESVVVVDEAYVDFGARSAIELVARHPNLLVVQTFSKSRSLAGLRVGFAVGSPELIAALDRVKNSFNSYPLGRLAIVGAVAAIDDDDYFQATRQRVMVSRAELTEQLSELGFHVLPSAANFLFVRHEAHDAATLQAKLRERSIIVRHFRAARIDQFLRVTVGTPAQCAALTSALRDICSRP